MGRKGLHHTNILKAHINKTGAHWPDCRGRDAGKEGEWNESEMILKFVTSESGEHVCGERGWIQLWCAQFVVARAIQMENVNRQMKCETGTQKAGPGKFWKSLFYQHRCDGGGWDHTEHTQNEKRKGERKRNKKQSPMGMCCFQLCSFHYFFLVHFLRSSFKQPPLPLCAILVKEIFMVPY